jgi:DNA-binding GntR family transcriptional regulator
LAPIQVPYCGTPVNHIVRDVMNHSGPRPGLGADRARGVAQRIERDIALGHLGAGAWLKQVELEARYDATRMEVRQALDQLVAKRLVQHLPRRGYRVEEFDPARLAQVMEIRAVLEVAAAELVIERLDQAALAAMHAAAERFRDAVLDGLAEEQEEANLAFHRAMLAACPNQELVALIFELRSRVPIAITRRRNTQAVMQRSSEQHFEIIRLVRARDLPGLRRMMRDHNLSPAAPGA